MPKVAKPGSPVIHRMWPVAAGPLTVVMFLVGIAYAATSDSGWSGILRLAVPLFVASVLANGMRMIAARHPSARQFAFQDDVDEAEQVVRLLERAGLEFLAAEAWDNLSRASMGGHRREMSDLQQTLRTAAWHAIERAPGAEAVREFEAHVKALDQKLREDPK